jgi:hypothetical protein
MAIHIENHRALVQWGIYHRDREFAREVNDPCLAVVRARTKEAAEQKARRQGVTGQTGMWAHPLPLVKDEPAVATAAAFADLFEQFVAADHLRRGFLGGNDANGRVGAFRAAGEEAVPGKMAFKQQVKTSAEGGIVPADAIEELVTLGRK